VDTRSNAGSVLDSVALPRLPSLPPAAAVAIAVAGLTGTAFAFVVALLGGYVGHDGLVATGRAAAVLLPVGVGLHQWRSRAKQLYPALLVLLGLWMAPVALAESHAAVPYSAGRVTAWIAEYLIILLLLVFPAGVLRGRRDRALAAAMGAALLLLYLPTALVVDTYPVPSAPSTCVAGCPANAFQVLSEPAFVGDVMIPLREVATVLLTVAVAGIVAGRLRAASHLARITLAPGLIVAVIHVFSLGTFFGLRTANAVSGLLTALGWVVYLTPAFIAVALATAETRRRQYVACALERLAVGLPSHGTAASLRRGMASSLEDPTLRIVYHLDDDDADRWVDESGWPVAPPEATAGGLTEISSGTRPVAAIIHDPWLTEDPALLAAAASYAIVVLENERLVTDLRSSLEELAESRARLVAVADRERRRIERDLHDGAQQRLVGLRIQLELAAQRLRRVVPRESEALLELGGSVEEAIDEVRLIARGVFPALLAEQGLEEALRSAARRAPIATGVSVTGLRRWAPEIETTVYFACVEALQNAIKHAGGATAIAIVLDGSDASVRFEVRDDGRGFVIDANGNGATRGSGLVNMRDRVGALGGSLAIVSSPGVGTRVIGSVPSA
jgi:signal transduction histidine kinase